MKNPATGKSRGFGFVTFKDPACVETVLSSGPHVLDDRQVNTVSNGCSDSIMTHSFRQTGTRLMASFPGQPRVKPIWILIKHEMMGWQ